MLAILVVMAGRQARSEHVAGDEWTLLCCTNDLSAHVVRHKTMCTGMGNALRLSAQFTLLIGKGIG
jgi:hypothetical protein